MILPPSVSEYMWFDNKYVCSSEAKIPITTHAIHYGTTVFEGIKAYWNGENLHVFRVNDHVRRLRRSAEYYNIALYHSDKQISDIITGICKKNNLTESCYIRPLCLVGEYGIDLNVTFEAPTIMAVIAFPHDTTFEKSGICAYVSSWRKFSGASTHIQSKAAGNYLNAIVAIQDAKKHGADDAILLDQRGYVSEASTSNIFIVDADGQLVTPPTTIPESSALDGITSDTVITISKDIGIPHTHKDITLDELKNANEIFLTGTASEIIPVTSLGGSVNVIGKGTPGIITKQIMDAYHNIVMGKDTNHTNWLTAVYP